ncbi:Transposon Ty3-G Gag-Pol poly [Paramuricea clavata]|uniref:Transposon Ty3-G Gag-Pol poly n=1 Tax=Paramuricea clavata TaxID=317549 RepID=A0A7D9LUK5_PARCT|nr:Transposon Ty3-G Gag-Pol poly [Paramuricea clavata]
MVIKVDDKRKSEISSSTKQFPKRLYASITVGKQPMNFQLNSGVTCNVISLSMLERCLGKVQLKGTTRVLKMYNKATTSTNALKDYLKAELERLESESILKVVTEPTPWVSNMVIVRKPTGKLRICIDPKDLNKATRRSHYPIPTIDEILPDLREARVFSVFDVRNGFWHVVLNKESSLLTTFITPFGRRRWLRMPFGLTSAPEEFQQRQHRVIENLPGVVAIHDDILVIGNGATREEAQRDHDVKVHALMRRCREKNTTLNADKVKLSCNEVTFMGHLLTDEGLKPDPDKVRAILEMPKPTDVAAVRRLIGFVNYLQRFLPNLSGVYEPLRKLTHNDTAWRSTEEQQLAFDTMKQLVGEVTILKYYQPSEELTLQCDASEKGLGAVISQNGQPLAFPNRALSRAEVNYAQIEKELLAVLFGLEKFRQYTCGRPV